MMFEEIENEVREKEKFIQDQNDRMKNMQEVKNSLLEYKHAMQKAAKAVTGTSGSLSISQSVDASH